MTGEDALRRWMAGYERAWKSNDPGDIGALFTDDATYRTLPTRPPHTGRRAIVDWWLEHADQPGDYTFTWEPLSVAPDGLAFVAGRTIYPGLGKDFENLWVLRLDGDGRCSDFTEWWIEYEK